MTHRRKVLKQLAVLPVAGSLVPSGMFSPLIQNSDKESVNPLKRDYFQELGVRTFINAAGTYTFMTGSLMRPEVIEAIANTSDDFVNLNELQDKVGARIAELLDCEAATVTSGAASAISLGTAGCISGADPKNAALLPHIANTKLKSEVIMQRKHSIEYAHAIEVSGAKVIYVDTKDELEAAINEKTAMYYFVNFLNYEGQIQWQEILDICQKHNVPTMIDCAADVPPVENLFKFQRMGFDMVCFSGGKGLRGPQSAGILLGKKKYIDAARLNAPPFGETIGRGMKVNKEEIVGMLVAIEDFLNRDHEKDWLLWENQIELIKNSVSSFESMKTEVVVPELANVVPTLHLKWDNRVLSITGNQLKEALRTGHPSIEVAGGGNNSVSITTWMLKPGQERIVASRLKEIFNSKSEKNNAK